MALPVSQFSWSDAVQRGQPLIMDCVYQITAAKTVTNKTKNSTLTAFDAIAAQATIDSFLGTTNEFLIAQFDATAMGTDAFAVIANLGGQASELVGVRAFLNSGTNGATAVSQSVVPVATLTSSSLTTQAALGSSGNVAARFILSGVDILTAGVIQVQFMYRAK